MYFFCLVLTELALPGLLWLPSAKSSTRGISYWGGLAVVQNIAVRILSSNLRPLPAVGEPLAVVSGTELLLLLHNQNHIQLLKLSKYFSQKCLPKMK